MNSVTRRVEFGRYPKYELITSHNMKRSFATNYFGKIATPILMEITGHSRESTFLEYVGKNATMDPYADILIDTLSKK